MVTLESPRRSGTRARLAGVTALLVVLVAPVAACTGRSSPTEPAGPGGATSAPVQPPPASPSGGGQGGGAVTPSAADQLADFFAGAARIDAKLRDAAKLINGSVRRDVIVLTPATVAAVRDIKPHLLVGTIPGGLDRELLRSVMLVYSDLVSRRSAMNRVATLAPPATLPRAGSEAKDLITCLGNGSPAARRFAGDLAAARALAAASDPVVVAPRNSRRTAEIAVHAQYIDLLNGGCDSCGGGVLTSLRPLLWKQQDGFDGTIGGIPFQAAFRANSGWSVMLNAC